MNLFLVLGLLTAVFASSGASGELYPVGNDTYFPGGSLDISLVGKRIAIEGTITRIEPGPVAKPLLELELSFPSSQKLWVASTMADGMSLHKVGDPVRVLGFLTTMEPSDTELAKVSDDKQFLIGYCIFDLAKKKGQFLPAGLSDCKAWAAGAKAGNLP